MFNVIKLIKVINIVSCVVLCLSLVFLCTADPSKEMTLVQIAFVWGIVSILFGVSALVHRWAQTRLDHEKEYQHQVSQRRIDRELDKYDNVIRVNFSNR